MTHLVTIALSGQPRGKGRPRFTRQTGRAYSDPKTAKFESHLRLAAQDAMGGRAPFDLPLAVRVHARLPIPQSWSGKKQMRAQRGEVLPTSRPDADNYAKMLDGLNAVVFRDDSLIVDLAVTKRYSTTPELLIEVSAAKGESA